VSVHGHGSGSRDGKAEANSVDIKNNQLHIMYLGNGTHFVCKADLHMHANHSSVMRPGA